jgi:hypothetical protein
VVTLRGLKAAMSDRQSETPFRRCCGRLQDIDGKPARSRARDSSLRGA